ncbi:Spo0B domain-containing protein [Brevibacillus sp. H7]|uniref:Spo0B domain-containing protein n=1 Tax=Brevibacillus sp. H7 TaxID=3349138 RepID=UPI0037F6596D
MRDEQKLFKQQTDQLLKVLNQQRHDWLNHFQVLLGYLRLGRPEQGVEYLQRVTELTYQESMIARINSSLLSVFFLTFNALHTDLLLEVEIGNQVDLTEAAVTETELFRFVTDLILSVKEHVNRHEYEPASMLVSLFADERGIHFRFDLAGGLRASGLEEVEKLVHSSKQHAMDVAEWIHTNEEWVLEVVVPVVERKR